MVKQMARAGVATVTGKVSSSFGFILSKEGLAITARLAQSAERKALNLAVVGSSTTVGALTSVYTRNKSSSV